MTSTKSRLVSFLRTEEYKAISEVKIDGKILDVGGSKYAGYHELIKGKHEFIVGNIDSSFGTDLIFNAENQWPFDGDHFDATMLINVLEHLSDYRTALSEANRVTKKGGVIIGVVPFMFNVHGSPGDYFRYTKTNLVKILSDAGFGDIEVRELGTGAFSVVYHCLMGLYRFRFVSRAVMALCRKFDELLARIKPNNLMSKTYMPLGYFLKAIKPH